MPPVFARMPHLRIHEFRELVENAFDIAPKTLVTEERQCPGIIVDNVMNGAPAHLHRRMLERLSPVRMPTISMIVRQPFTRLRELRSIDDGELIIEINLERRRDGDAQAAVRLHKRQYKLLLMSVKNYSSEGLKMLIGPTLT